MVKGYQARLEALEQEAGEVPAELTAAATGTDPDPATDPDPTTRPL